MSHEPHFGHTKHGLPVHLRTADHLKAAAGDSRYQRFNKRFALILVKNVGTMTCFWVFCLLSLTVLPSVLYAMGLVSLKHLLPAFVLGFGFELLTTWLFSTGLQLVLLPGLMVGQNVQNQAADARAAKQFEDTEKIVDALDLKTQGSLADVNKELLRIGDQVNEVHRHVTALAPKAGLFPPSEEKLPAKKAGG
jgi:hypothetical protein